MSKTDLPTVFISRSHVNPTIEIYMGGEIIGFIDVEPKTSNRTILRIKNPLFLRFVRAEIEQERKDKILFPNRHKPGSKP